MFPSGGTHITRDMCFPGGAILITRDMCFLGEGTHIIRDMCFPGGGTRITRDRCFPGGGSQISRNICFQGGGTHISRDMCFLGGGMPITRDMCFPAGGRIYHFCFVLLCIWGQFPSTPGGYFWRGDLTEGFLHYEFGGLLFGGAYFRNFTIYDWQDRTWMILESVFVT